MPTEVQGEGVSAQEAHHVGLRLGVSAGLQMPSSATAAAAAPAAAAAAGSAAESAAARCTAGKGAAAAHLQVQSHLHVVPLMQLFGRHHTNGRIP